MDKGFFTPGLFKPHDDGQKKTFDEIMQHDKIYVWLKKQLNELFDDINDLKKK